MRFIFMKKQIQKRLHKHGGSKAVDLPSAFIKKLSNDRVNIEMKGDTIIIRGVSHLDNLEAEPNFQLFIECLLQDALKNPDKLTDIRKLWDSEWDDLLEGVIIDEE